MEEKQEYADLVFTKLINNQDIATSTINDSVNDYVLRCIKGPYAGHFIYLNLTELGESIGSDEKSKDLTLVIENAGLSSLHCTIHYELDEKDQFRYTLRDYSSDLGTWITIRQESPQVIKHNMIFRIDNERFQIKFSEEEFDEVKEWLEKAELQNLYQDFQSKDIKTLQDIEMLSNNEEKIDKIMNHNNKKRFLQVMEDFKQDFQDNNYHKHFLEIISLQDESVKYKVGWCGSVIDTSINKKNDYNSKNEEDHQLVIRFRFGAYWLQTLSVNSNAHWQLTGDQPYILSPEDHIHMGSLEFVVQRFNTGAYQDQGGRLYMEDEIVTVQNVIISYEMHVSFFAVFDGHGGDECAKFVSSQIIDNIRNLVSVDNDLDKRQDFFQFIFNIFHESIQFTDIQFFESNAFKKSTDSGSVGCMTLIIGNVIIIANIGDCRAIISRNGKAIHLSKDHKPYDESEKKRVQEAGGFVEFNRVNSKLAVSRAFGDFRYKKEQNSAGSDIISVEPEIRYHELDFTQDEFLIIGCDGIFDIFSSQECVEFVRNEFLKYDLMEQDPQEVAKLLVQEVIQRSRSQKKAPDNTTVVIVLFTRGIVGKASQSDLADIEQ